MKQLLKKSRLIWATALMAQAGTLLVLSVCQSVKNKRVSKSLLATSLVEGAIGATLFAKLVGEEREVRVQQVEEELAEHAYYTIPLDETASESDFS